MFRESSLQTLQSYLPVICWPFAGGEFQLRKIREKYDISQRSGRKRPYSVKILFAGHLLIRQRSIADMSTDFIDESGSFGFDFSSSAASKYLCAMSGTSRAGAVLGRLFFSVRRKFIRQILTILVHSEKKSAM